MKEKEKNLLVVTVVGMPGTGKSEVLKTLVEKFGFKHLYYGDITFEEVARLGLELNEKNERIAREGLRASGDMAIYSRKMLPKIEQAIKEGNKKIILESMYNVHEYEVIKERYKGNFKVLAIHTDRQIRIDRLSVRKERKLTEEELDSREVSEAKNLWKGTLIAMADYHYLNNGTNMKVFENDLRVFFRDKLNLHSTDENFLRDYNRWNDKKKTINTDDSILEYPKKREVWMINLGLNVGFEQNGDGENFSRPILILKKFNNQMFWGIPLSTKQKDFNFYYNFTDVNQDKVSAILAQLKLFSIKRFSRKLYDLDTEVFSDIQEKIKNLI